MIHQRLVHLTYLTTQNSGPGQTKSPASRGVSRASRAACANGATQVTYVTYPTLSPSNAERFHVTHEASGRRRIGGVKERPRALGSCNQRHRMTSV